MYGKIRDRMSIRELYTEHLVMTGELSTDEVETIAETFRDKMEEVYKEVHDGQGIKFAIKCPWAHEHSNGTTGTYLGQRTNGATWFYCNHAHCAGRGWREFKTALFWNRTIEFNNPSLRMEVRYGGR